MKLIYQDKFGENGNCMSAVIATMLQIELSEVPYFIDGLNSNNGKTGEENAVIFWDRIDEFLSTKNLEIIHYSYDLSWLQENPDCYFIVSGMSPRGRNHATIYKGCEEFHDPHHEGGFVDPSEISVIQRLSNG